MPELANEDNKSNDTRKYSEKDETCQIVLTQDGVVMTKDLLQERLMQVLSSAGGRLSIDDASTLLAVDSYHIEQHFQEYRRYNSSGRRLDYRAVHGSHGGNYQSAACQEQWPCVSVRPGYFRVGNANRLGYYLPCNNESQVE